MSRHIRKINSIIFKKGYNSTTNRNILEKISSLENANVIAIYNPECIGIMNSTKDIFENTIPVNEVFSKRFAEEVSDVIVNSNIKQVVFSSLTFGWKQIVELLHIKNPDIKIKFFWHGAHSMLVQRDEPYFLYSIMEMYDRNLVHSIGFAKESMAEFYNLKGYNSYFVPNTVKEINKDNLLDMSTDNLHIKIGLYSAGSRWEKNTFNQLSAVSLIKNAIVDILPSNKLTNNFCELMNITVKSKKIGYIPRQELLNRMAQNDVNLYVTFTECSPVIPLESLELGVPCITGNNHHYFKDTKLYDYLVVKSEDDINEIASKIQLAIDNKEEILELYKQWKPQYDDFAKQKLQEFIDS